METVIILPNQLFENNKLINSNTKVYIYEHNMYFTKYKYHKLKLILHRATMKNYEDYLLKKYKCKVKYLEYTYDISMLFKKYKGKRIDMYDPVDHDIMKEFKKYSKELFVHDTPLFLCTIPDLTSYLDNGGTFHQTTFYIWQRKRLDILMKDGKPIGGKWTFDTENRLPFPKDFKKDFKPNVKQSNKYIIEATKYIEKNFSDNVGLTDFYLPIDFKGAKEHFKKFLAERLECFGKYQDAVNKDIVFGCHSIISPLLNVGLLTPQYVVNEALEYYKKHKIPIESIEGFLRQIIGWREILRLTYMFKHKEMKSLNHFNHKRKLDKKWFTDKPDTGIVVIDDLIQKVMKYGYAHHIERLMYLSNFMLITEIDPDDVYNWFMIFIDAYPWVMYGNVYAMGQYSTGPLLMTRPYFSSSNYIDKMSSYKKKKDIYEKIKINNKDYEWYEIWDALYYNFINNNKKEFSKNYAIASSVSHWNKKSKSEQNNLLKIAKGYLKSY